MSYGDNHVISNTGYHYDHHFCLVLLSELAHGKNSTSLILEVYTHSLDKECLIKYSHYILSNFFLEIGEPCLIYVSNPSPLMTDVLFYVGEQYTFTFGSRPQQMIVHQYAPRYYCP